MDPLLIETLLRDLLEPLYGSMSSTGWKATEEAKLKALVNALVADETTKAGTSEPATAVFP